MPGSSPEATVTVADTPIDDTTVTSPVTVETTDEKADPSPATAGTMLDAVNAALKPKEVSPTSTEPGQADEADPDKPKAGAEGTAEDELSPEELKAIGWKAQKRFKSLSTQLKNKDAELGGLKSKADEYDKITSHITQAGLDNREVGELIEVGALLKRDPHAALARMLPIVEKLQGLVGEVLPAELQERVRLGYLTEADARALNRAKAGESLAKQNADRVSADAQAKEAHEKTTKLVNSSISAVESWEKAKADKDPDWHLKRKEVAELVELAITREAQKRREPYFPTSEEAVKFSEDALKTVNDRIKRFKPTPNEIRSGPSGSASPRSKQVAKTTLDAINNAL